MPRAKKGQKKAALNKPNNDNVASPNNSNKKFFDGEDVKNDEKFSKLKTIDPAPVQSNRGATRNSRAKKIQLSRKVKNKLYKLKQTFDLPTVLSDHSRHSSTKSLYSRGSTYSYVGENIDGYFKRGLMMLRKEGDIRKEPLDADQLKQTVLGSDEDIVNDDEAAEPDMGSETETDSDSGSEKDKLDKIKKDFTRSHIEKRTSQTEIDFFDGLGDIPDIDGISLDTSEESEEEEVLVRLSSSDEKGDVGKFVDPLTGAEITSSSSLAIPTQMEESMFTMESEESVVDLLGEVTFDEDEELAQASRADVDDDRDKEDFQFGKWIQGRGPQPTESITEIFTQAVYDEYLRKVGIHILDFIDELIARVVKESEYGDSGRVFGKAIDKKKLMSDLDDKIQKLEIARKENVMLNKGVVKFFYNKGDLRPLKQDHPEKVNQLMEKNEEQHDRLCSLMVREEELQIISSLKISNLRADVEEAEKNANLSVDDLEKLVTKAFCRDRFQYLNGVVARSLRQMSNTRDAITKQRYLLLQKLHTLSDLKEKEEKLENLGSGLKMRNFEVLQAAVTNLDTKIFERDRELNYLHVKRNKDLHMMMHLMDCHSMVQADLSIKENVLMDLHVEKQRAREELTSAKLHRTKTYEEISILQHESGLAGNKALLLDYDETTKNLQEARARVSKMRQKYTQLEAHLSRLEERCNRASSI